MFPLTQVNHKDCEIGLGQHSMATYRYELIEYLPQMFTYGFIVMSQKPESITSFDALVFPLDSYTWYFTFISSMGILILLVIIQKCWIQASGQKPSNGWLFQGDMSYLSAISALEELANDILNKSLPRHCAFSHSCC